MCFSFSQVSSLCHRGHKKQEFCSNEPLLIISYCNPSIRRVNLRGGGTAGWGTLHNGAQCVQQCAGASRLSALFTAVYCAVEPGLLIIYRVSWGESLSVEAQRLGEPHVQPPAPRQCLFQRLPTDKDEFFSHFVCWERIQVAAELYGVVSSGRRRRQEPALISF